MLLADKYREELVFVPRAAFDPSTSNTRGVMSHVLHVFGEAFQTSSDTRTKYSSRSRKVGLPSSVPM